MNVAFFGTSDRSIPILETLRADKDIKLVLCVTKEDTRVGRKQEVRETEVKKWATAHNVKLLTISLIKQDTPRIIEQLIDSKVDLGLVADFSYIIPETIINTLPYKMINIHFSLLPKWRGASPVQFAILNGEETTGITYYVMDKGMDTGDVIYQIGYKMTRNETSGELYTKLFALAAENLPKVIKGYMSGEIIPKPQEHELASYTFSPTRADHTFIYKEDAKIDWNKSAEEIERAIRAYHPWPIAWTTLPEILRQVQGTNINDNTVYQSKRVKIFEAKLLEGNIKIEKLQVEGGKIIDWKSFINGYLTSSTTAGSEDSTASKA